MKNSLLRTPGCLGFNLFFLLFFCEEIQIDLLLQGEETQTRKRIELTPLSASSPYACCPPQARCHSSSSVFFGVSAVIDLSKHSGSPRCSLSVGMSGV